jgi:hypothetical protein
MRDHDAALDQAIREVASILKHSDRRFGLAVTRSSQGQKGRNCGMRTQA